MYNNFWKNKKVLITGHTGFKGSWLALILQYLGAEVIGFALPPPTKINLFELANVSKNMISLQGDIRDFVHLKNIIAKHKPEVIFHLAAQPIVLRSHQDPVETFSTNVLGVVNLLEAIRQTPFTTSVVNVTSDKCYENQNWVWGCRENDTLGGVDPYSSSKACSELISHSYRSSFFANKNNTKQKVRLATVRAGNVIGGGDWSEYRIVPDCVQAWMHGDILKIRSPNAVRPWQHVLEPLCGYLKLAQALYEQKIGFEEAWNFGPSNNDVYSVQDIIKIMAELWGELAKWELDYDINTEEAYYLKLDVSKANSKLGWSTILDIETTLKYTVDWYKYYQNNPEKIGDETFKQIDGYISKIT